MQCNVLRSRLSARVAGLRDKASKARYAPRPLFGKLLINRGNSGQPGVFPRSMSDMLAKYKGRSEACSLCDRDLTRALGGEHIFAKHDSFRLVRYGRQVRPVPNSRPSEIAIKERVN